MTPAEPKPKGGLEDVVAGSSAICFIDGERGVLSYAGYDIHDLASGATRKLASHTEAYLDETPSWFPDGKRLAFQSNRTGRMEVWVMNADGSAARQLSDEPFFNYYSFAWSPDSRQIAYLRSDQMDLTQPVELWIMGADGSNPVRITSGSADNSAPCWVP